VKVLIQSKEGRPYNISATIAAYGFVQRGYETIPFAVEEIDALPFERQNVVVGGVGTYQRVLPKLGIAWEGESYPESLLGYLGRELRVIPLRELPALVETRPRFIKPAQDNKAFTGFVCSDRWDPRLSGIGENCALVCADVINFASEYRVYVLDGKIQNICRYHGRADVFPNGRIVREMIRDYEGPPIAFGLDVGVDDKNKRFSLK
jgi:hypothetical protein